MNRTRTAQSVSGTAVRRNPLGCPRTALTAWLLSSASLLLIAGCASGATARSTASAAPRPAAARSTTPLLPVFHEASPRSIPAGRYRTGAYGFFPGLEITIPEGWTATETDGGEIGLQPTDHPENTLMLWKDMAAVVTNNRHRTVGQVRDDVGRTAEDLLGWLTKTPDFEVVSRPVRTTVGSSIPGTQLTVTSSKTANFALKDCPDNPRCAAILTDPAHWGDNFFAIGGAEVARVFVASVTYADGDHTFLVTLDSPNPAALRRFAVEAEPIIRSLRLPTTFVSN